MKKYFLNFIEWVGGVVIILLTTKKPSPLNRLGPYQAHSLFQGLAFLWACIFATYAGSWIMFGISAMVHIFTIAGFFFVYAVWYYAERRTKVHK
jgi:ABC-type multidrug transport system permease subunit